jgi:hypothetical protein
MDHRAVVSRKTLDALIRAKLATLKECPHVEPLPVTLSEHHGHDCNWTIPGWVGDAGVVNRCLEKLEHYLEFLRDQFNIPAQGNGVAD